MLGCYIIVRFITRVFYSYHIILFRVTVFDNSETDMSFSYIFFKCLSYFGPICIELTDSIDSINVIVV